MHNCLRCDTIGIITYNCNNCCTGNKRFSITFNKNSPLFIHTRMLTPAPEQNNGHCRRYAAGHAERSARLKNIKSAENIYETM